jgi:SAM-dependent methyltransferase
MLSEDDTQSVIRSISANDRMFDPDYPEAYFLYGQSALHHIRHAFAVSGVPDPRRILDIPSGHGRVLQTLRAAFPEAEITACDIDRDGVDFCARTFAARGVYSRPDPRELELNSSFDLIWVGSLLTHFDASRWADFLLFFQDHLTPGGLLVFTTHGHYYADALSDDRKLPAFAVLDAKSRAALLADFRVHGFGYQAYPGVNDYGLSLSAPSWVTARLADLTQELRLVSYTERAWRGTHDIVACQRGYRRRLPTDAP